jgi:hypothetical protein
VRYEITKKPLTLYACHSTASQQQTASAFGLSLLVEREGFTIIKGQVARFEFQADGKTRKEGMFCPDCGVRIAHDTQGHPALSVKAGTLDIRANLVPAGHIWTKSAVPWMQFPEDSLVYDYAPDDGYFALIERWASQEHAS